MTADLRQRNSLYLLTRVFYVTPSGLLLSMYVSQYGIQVLCNLSIRVRVMR